MGGPLPSPPFAGIQLGKTGSGCTVSGVHWSSSNTGGGVQGAEEVGLTDGSTGVLLCSVPLPLPCPTLPRPQGSRVHGDRGDNVDLHCFPAHHTGPSASSGGGACDKEAESTKAFCSSQGVCKEVRGVGVSIGPPDHPPSAPPTGVAGTGTAPQQRGGPPQLCLHTQPGKWVWLSALVGMLGETPI